MNNLLDGSLKSVASASRGLREAAGQPADGPLERLASAEQLLQRMAGLIEAVGGVGDAAGNVSLASDAAQTKTLGEAIDEALGAVASEASERGVVLDALVDPRVAALPADALFTVVSNALRNALEAVAELDAVPGTMRTRPRIELRLVRDERDAVLSIADTGPGIDASLLAPGGGFRFGVTTKPNGHGIGLGLSRQVAAALGGKLWLRERIPHGAVLTLRFPLSSLRDAVASPSERGGA